MQRVFVGATGGLLLDDLTLLELAVDLHRKAGHSGAVGQHQPEAPLDDPVLGVVEGQPQLGEGQGSGDDGVDLVARQRETAAVGGRQRNRGVHGESGKGECDQQSKHERR